MSTRIDAPIVLDLVMLGLFGFVRSTSDNALLGAWVVAAMLVAIRWPGSGLGLAAAIMVFPQPVRIGVPPTVAIIAAAAIGVVADLALRGAGPLQMRRSLAFVAIGAATLAAATCIGLMRSLVRLEPAVAAEAASRWVEFGAGLAFLLLLMRAFAVGSVRPIVLGLAGVTAGLIVALLDFVAPTLLPSLRVRWPLSGADSSRATGPFASPNRLGTVAALMVVVGSCLALADRARRWMWAVLALLALVALVISFSRGALLALVIAGGAILAVRSRRAALAYAVVVVAIAAIAVPVLVGARLSGSGATLEVLLSNDEGRVDAWLAGARMILEEPIFGHGYYSFAALGASFGATDGLKTAHNETIGFWAETGVLAAVGYLLLSGAIVAAGLERRPDPWALAAVGSMIVLFVASSFNVQTMFLAVAGPVWLVVAYGIARPVSGDDEASSIATEPTLPEPVPQPT